MKKIIAIVISLSILFVTNVNCFASTATAEDRSKERAGTMSNLSSSHTSAKQFDNIGNSFKITSTSSIVGKTGNVTTSFKVSTYAGGDTASINGVKETCYTDSTVYFSDGTTSNTAALDGSNAYTGKSSGSISKSKTFTANISILKCVHKFTTNSGISYSYTTTDSAL